ncbi:hypothetical protein [Catelliglobosispora koreensis]|uniref:hypothetical protein n=1 Tax=Catelliglobosispora koreensis TaxID=129052 RepID=UPI00036D46CF|nr:hypothetical protein [Catelliglobosispora koreensis]
MTALDFAVAAVILVPMSFVIAVCVDEIRKAYRRHRGEKRVDAHAAKRRAKFRIRPPFAQWRTFEHELPADASASQMREAIGPSFGLGFEDDTEDDDEVTATPKGEYL